MLSQGNATLVENLFPRTGHEDPGMRPNFATALTLLQDVLQEAKGAAFEAT